MVDATVDLATYAALQRQQRHSALIAAREEIRRRRARDRRTLDLINEELSALRAEDPGLDP